MTTLERVVRVGVLQALVDDVPGEHIEEFRELAVRYLGADIDRVRLPTLRAPFGLVLRRQISGESLRG